jgi:hypothetical protein
MAIKTNTLYGIRNADGSFTFGQGDPTGSASPYDNMPFLIKKYKTARSVRMFLKNIATTWRENLPEYSYQDSFQVDSIASLQAKLKTFQWKTKYIYIWVPVGESGMWTYWDVWSDGSIQDPYFMNDMKGVFEQVSPEWMQKNIYSSKYVAPPKRVAKKRVPKRLSKEDWLKKNYPELTELPKWRFPAMVAG